MNRMACAFVLIAAFACVASACVAFPTRVRVPSAVPSATHTALITRIPFPPTAAPTPPPTLPRPHTPTPILLTAPQPTPRPHQFDEADARMLLSALFPDFKLTPDADAFRVNADPNWTVWLTSRVEGYFTQDAQAELAAIIVHDPPRASDAERGAFLAIFQARADKFTVVQRAFIFPAALVPPAFDARIERATDFDRDGRDELLIVTFSETLGVTTAAAFLYGWDDQAFVPLWSAVLAEDNTSALNQPAYFTTEGSIVFADVDGDGWDEIIVESVRIDYARDAQGLADTDHETRRRAYRSVYRWRGAAFAADPARTTPLPK